MFLAPPPPPSFNYGLVTGVIGYFICRSLSPILTKLFGTSSFKQKVDALDEGKRYHYHSLLPSTIHALAQIIGTCHIVFWGREGYDNVNGISPAILFDDRLHVPYAPHLGPAVFMGIFVGYLLADILAAPSLSMMGVPFVIHREYLKVEQISYCVSCAHFVLTTYSIYRATCIIRFCCNYMLDFLCTKPSYATSGMSISIQ